MDGSKFGLESQWSPAHLYWGYLRLRINLAAEKLPFAFTPLVNSIKLTHFTAFDWGSNWESLQM